MTDVLKKKIKKIKVIAFDVDGVLTNGKINYDENGREFKVFDVQDGLASAVLRKVDIKTAIITARSSGCVEARAKDIKIDQLYQDAYPKIGAFDDLLKTFQVDKSEVCFVGDDLPDLCVLKEAGLAVAVRNAALEVKKQADYVTRRNGGDGAVREVIELILKTQGKWKTILEHFA